MKETVITSITAIGAGLMSTLLGGWDKALEILLIFVTLDYLTGITAAFKTKTLQSSAGYVGLMKKATIFLVVILASQLDRMTGNTAGIFRTATAFFFTANEGLSVLENVGKLGVKLPGFIAKTLERLRDDNDDFNHKEDAGNDG